MLQKSRISKDYNLKLYVQTDQDLIIEDFLIIEDQQDIVIIDAGVRESLFYLTK